MNNFKKFKAFSLIEILLTLVAISLILAAFAPVITKKLKSTAIVAGNMLNLTTHCEDVVNEDCKLCYYPKGPCIKCNKTCDNPDEFLDIATCECRKCNDIENGGIENCYSCSKHWQTGLRCDICMPGRVPAPITGKRCNINTKYAMVGNVAWTARNAGESDGPAFEWGDGTDGTVVRCEAGQPCSGGGTTPTCWVGNTANQSTCTNSDGYSGCNRPVCNWYAANLICANAEMSLPTNAQFYDLRGGSASTAAYNQPSVKFCNENSSLASTYSRCNYVANCTGSNGSHCGPDSVWGVENGSSNGHSYYLNSGNLNGSISQNKGIAYSVRCTKACTDFDPHCTKCTLAGCTGCSDRYYYNAQNEACAPCPSHCAVCTSGSSCNECENGFELNNSGSCEAIPISTTSINGLAWTVRNPGDNDGPAIPDSVTICEVGQACSGGNVPTCWRGATSISCDNADSSYGGCNRTVCNWFAGNIICESIGMTLPTLEQAFTIKGNNSSYNTPQLHLCDVNVSSSSVPYSKCQYKAGCNGTYEGYCSPQNVYTDTQASIYLSNGNIGNDSVTKQRAQSIRCIKECTTLDTHCTACTISSCTECESGYYWNGYQCVSCSSTFDINCSECNSTQCTACASHYYLNSGSNTCNPCSSHDANCTECIASGCTECTSPYTTDGDGGCQACVAGYYYSAGTCIPCTTFDSNCSECTSSGCSACSSGYLLGGSACIAYTTVSGVQWTTRNAGDAGGPPIPNSIVTCTAGSSCSGGGTTPTCWQGNTANQSTCTNSDGYSGCNRTMCNWYAAQTICSNAGMSVPTTAQYNQLRGGSSNEATYTQPSVKFCDPNSSNSNYSKCPGIGNCTGGYDNNWCTPDVTWGEGGASWGLKNNKINGPASYNQGYARGVRCVKTAS